MEFQFLAKTVSLFITEVVFSVRSTEQDTTHYTPIIFLYFFFPFILRYAAFLPLPSFPVTLEETTLAVRASAPSVIFSRPNIRRMKFRALCFSFSCRYAKMQQTLTVVVIQIYTLPLPYIS